MVTHVKKNVWIATRRRVQKGLPSSTFMGTAVTWMGERNTRRVETFRLYSGVGKQRDDRKQLSAVQRYEYQNREESAGCCMLLFVTLPHYS